MKKKVVVSIIAAALVAAVGMGSTLAYLQDETGTKTNTFTIGDVKIDLDEPEWDPTEAEDMLPGATVSKNPIVTNVGQSEAFIGIRVDGMKEVTGKGFLVKSDKANVELDNEGIVFAWNPAYTLVAADGEEVGVGSDNALTAEELAAMKEDVLFFAYNDKVAAGGQTQSLFDKVKLDTDVLGAPNTYTIVKHFVDEEDNILIEDANGLIQGTPAKNEAGEYKYVYSIADVVDLQNLYFETYDDAKDMIDSLEQGNEEFEFNMKVKAAAIQATNESNKDWAETSVWFKELPAAGFRTVE